MTELQELKVQYADAYRQLNLANTEIQNLQAFILETDNKIKSLERKQLNADKKEVK